MPDAILFILSLSYDYEDCGLAVGLWNQE